MSNVKDSVLELIGHTPMLRLCSYQKTHELKADIIVKMEAFNPAGSVKDRVGLAMIEDGEKTGRLKPSATLIEPTSGNTGIGIAMAAAAKGYHTILTMPETMSMERRKLLAAYGAEIVLTEGGKGMAGAIEKARELQKSIPGAVILGQFENPSNPEIHFKTTGPEIWEDLDGKVDILVAGVGTGGTLTGTARFLKSKNSSVQVVAVEPFRSQVLAGHPAGPHNLQGIGANFVPEVLDTTLYDTIIPVAEEDAYQAQKELVKLEGVLAGISSGAALWAASQLAKKPENAGKNIVVILPDTGERYLSTPLFD